MIKRSTLDQFTELGGYDVVKKTKDGRWKNVIEASRKTGISRQTIHRLLQEYPEPPSTHVLISQEDYERLKESVLRLKGVKKLLKQVQKNFGSSLIVNLKELRARQELLGESLESFQLALKQQVEADEKRESTIEKNFGNALQEFDSTLEILHRVIH